MWCLAFCSCGLRILGFPIVFDKAKIGSIMQWIGVELRTGQDCVIAVAPAEKIKELIARQEGYTQQQLGTIVKACRLQKAYDKQNIKIIWAAPDLESEMQGAIRASLVQSGAKHLVGSPARGGLENSLQKMLDKS